MGVQSDSRRSLTLATAKGEKRKRDSARLEGYKSELVLGLVYPVGTDVDPIVSTLEDYLKQSLGYSLNRIRISDYILNLDLGIPIPASPEWRRIDALMTAGNKARQKTERNDVLAMAANSKISETRQRDSDGSPQPRERVVHIIRSLKRPEEVYLLREAYRPGFYLIGVSSSETRRKNHLIERKGASDNAAERLIRRDQEEETGHGQKTQETFSLSDVFVPADSDYRDELQRFLKLVFGEPFTAPKPAEHAMFLAYSASVRSSSLSRQVGAAIASERGDVIAVGCNEVPCAQGGIYCEGDDYDKRDCKLGKDSSERYRNAILEDMLKRLSPYFRKKKPLPKNLDLLKKSRLSEVTEYGRALHAEMDALLSCARSGRNAKGYILYSTTFPCHNCTRHIIAAGVKKVVYIEPYPKSKAADLHSDAIVLEDEPTATDGAMKIPFVPFIGIGPRRYLDLFSMHLSAGRPRQRKVAGKMADWEWTSAQPRVAMLPTSYLDREEKVVSKIKPLEKRLGRARHVK